MMEARINIAARAIAKKCVEQELREQGVRVTLVRPAIIAEKARAYITSHPEIWAQALERAWKMEEIEEAEKAARRARRVRRSPT